jgi:hypothetical protein
VKSVNDLKGFLPDPLIKQEKLLDKAIEVLNLLNIDEAKPLFIKNGILFIEVADTYTAQMIQQNSPMFRNSIEGIKGIRTRQRNSK